MTTSTIKNNPQVISIRIINERTFNFILKIGVAVIVVLGTIYIMLTSSLSTRGFELQALKNERISIQKQLEEVDIAAIIPTSLYALQSSEIIQEMAEVTGQKFLRVTAGQVALR